MIKDLGINCYYCGQDIKNETFSNIEYSNLYKVAELLGIEVKHKCNLEGFARHCHCHGVLIAPDGRQVEGYDLRSCLEILYPPES